MKLWLKKVWRWSDKTSMIFPYCIVSNEAESWPVPLVVFHEDYQDSFLGGSRALCSCCTAASKGADRNDKPDVSLLRVLCWPSRTVFSFDTAFPHTYSQRWVGSGPNDARGREKSSAWQRVRSCLWKMLIWHFLLPPMFLVFHAFTLF